MAKGVEDTAFYRYNRLVSLNEVGGDPRQFGITSRAFHGASADRAAHWPHTMLATSTHDNKRSEDVRARIDVLSEMPGAWRAASLRRWSRMNRSTQARSSTARRRPRATTSTCSTRRCVGTLPPSELRRRRRSTAYRERIAGLHAQGGARGEGAHELDHRRTRRTRTALARFVARAPRSASGESRSSTTFAPHAARSRWFGMLNSLSMTLLKLTSPGVPDIYQGNELCDLSPGRPRQPPPGRLWIAPGAPCAARSAGRRAARGGAARAVASAVRSARRWRGEAVGDRPRARAAAAATGAFRAR